MYRPEELLERWAVSCRNTALGDTGPVRWQSSWSPSEWWYLMFGIVVYLMFDSRGVNVVRELGEEVVAGHQHQRQRLVVSTGPT
jgi:hypothetical protein